MATTARSGINEIIPGKLYQRGKLFTWQYPYKKERLEELGIDVIVNFWPKLDCNLEEWWVLQLSTNRSIDMLNSDIDIMAETVAMLIEDGKTVLVLCEAGKTRSVFFTVLVVSYLNGIDLTEALEIVEEAVPNHRLKKFMLDHINTEFCEVDFDE